MIILITVRLNFKILLNKDFLIFSWFFQLNFVTFVYFDIAIIFLQEYSKNCFNWVAGAMMFNYYIKLIPTVIERMDGYVFHTNQFSVTKFEKVGMFLYLVRLSFTV